MGYVYEKEKAQKTKIIICCIINYLEVSKMTTYYVNGVKIPKDKLGELEIKSEVVKMLFCAV